MKRFIPKLNRFIPSNLFSLTTQCCDELLLVKMISAKGQGDKDTISAPHARVFLLAAAKHKSDHAGRTSNGESSLQVRSTLLLPRPRFLGVA